ncbi:hypothetical protein A3C23_01885 [Candidatus Roizmanbacteria bacterium RIFCSPHIGHO2_02_FULL_37_13b]|uniref:LytR/CpsA/Psr regulator C-terminal domain-containing protein n=1 Tax=Candidatus Roizmanbacteria bacterium RIFCSPLOWO2_02_FULL_36_11 TaxID=1802071 RepID=A0A1F7JBM4_9BACT|nr:MAG: hypothetical protein A3C23_01885 [Candidatus Roizmanbacteria bacterium RIFCSPHIGHO2_02_FULL_37_13b]OGK53003.1 MAG: hypothetical protein A3H78_02205 [Candidatus Roizmanbacteria bacterium RIFCSPLOWO2_02_FULL_36_11]
MVDKSIAKKELNVNKSLHLFFLRRSIINIAMIYLFLDKNTVKLLSLSKALLGQFNSVYFQKNHENDLWQTGKVINVDLIASAVKEALTLSRPQAVTEKEVCLILPQSTFEFKVYDIPIDISESAILPFIRDKARADLQMSLSDLMYDYLLIKQNGHAKVLFFALSKSVYNSYLQALQLLGLQIANVVPETLAYFKLFEKTLRAEKKENILYVFYKEHESFSYLYNSFGLLYSTKYPVKKEGFELALKNVIEKLKKENVSLNRIILSGAGSEKFRQDLFTKEIGVWTNPLKKIILNFYQEYLKLIIISPSEPFPFLDYDVCLGAFIFSKENTQFRLNQPQGDKSSSPKMKLKLPNIGLKLRDISIFVFSFILTFLAIYLIPKLNINLPLQQSKQIVPVKIIPTSTIKPLPTPMVDKKTLKIKILNGSGVKGLAAVAKKTLQEKEYVEILTGNADSFDMDKTSVQVKEDKKAILNLFLTDINSLLKLDKSQISTLESSQSADIILILGKDFEK